MNFNLFLQNKLNRWVLAAILAATPIFLQFGGRGLNEPDEGRYAEMSREMLVSGDWLVPRLNGVPHYAKPPWIYWCVAASLKIFGIHEWGARFPSAIAALITALTVFALGYRMAGVFAGFISLMVLTASLLFMTAARLVTPDMMLTAGITVALYCFWRWWDAEHRSNRWLFGFYLALSMTFLDKGPVGIVVPFLTITGFLFLQKKIRELPKLCWGRGFLLVALIALPWFLLMCSLNPDLYGFYLAGEIKDRVVAGRGRVKVWYYFFLVLPIACWPWTALACSAARRHFQWWRSCDRIGVASCFLISWIVFPFILFTLSGSKLPTYILPLLVPVSLMLGSWLGRKIEEKEVSLPCWSQIFTWILLLGSGISLKHAVPSVLSQELPSIHLIAGGAVVWLLGLILIRFLPKEKFVLTYFILWWLTSLGMFHIILNCTPKFEAELRHNSSWRELTRSLKGLDLVGIPITLDLHPTGKKLSFVRPGPRVVMYEFYFRSSSFYLMQKKNEVVPLYAGNSLWELHRDINMEAKPVRDDLIRLLKEPETVFVFTRPQYLAELRDLTKMELPLIKTAGDGKYEVVLFSNQQKY